ncbi:hypothetical protein [Streptomyces sp. NPDC002537]
MRHRKLPAVMDPLGAALAWIWALGTVGTLAVLGLEVANDQGHHAVTSIEAPDQAPTF